MNLVIFVESADRLAQPGGRAFAVVRKSWLTCLGARAKEVSHGLLAEMLGPA